METLSSTATSFYKALFLFVWPIGFAIGTVATFVRQMPQRWVFALALVVGSAVLWRVLAGLKEVALEGSNLVIRNWGKQVVVPVSEIAAVHQNPVLSFKPVTIKLKTETAFGRWIVFMPPMSFRIFNEDEVVHRLRRLARASAPPP